MTQNMTQIPLYDSKYTFVRMKIIKYKHQHSCSWHFYKYVAFDMPTIWLNYEDARFYFIFCMLKIYLVRWTVMSLVKMKMQVHLLIVYGFIKSAAVAEIPLAQIGLH